MKTVIFSLRIAGLVSIVVFMILARTTSLDGFFLRIASLTALLCFAFSFLLAFFSFFLPSFLRWYLGITKEHETQNED